MRGRHVAKRWGAEPLGDGQWRFALWSPDAADMAVEIEVKSTAMMRGDDGWFSASAPASAGQAYAFRIDGTLYPDPAARAQAGDVHGPSLLVDPQGFAWREGWKGVPWQRAVLYELHVGTFTAEGTLDAARRGLSPMAVLRSMLGPGRQS